MNTLAELGDRTLKTIDSLEQNFARRARQWLDEMIQTGIRPLIYCGFRSYAEQAALYAQGRTKPGKIVTKAPAGTSYHNHGLAFDWVPAKQSAKDPQLWFADWDNETAYKVGEQAGITFNLIPISWEQGHLQDGRYKTWRDIPGSNGNSDSGIKAAAAATKTTGKVRLRKP